MLNNTKDDEQQSKKSAKPKKEKKKLKMTSLYYIKGESGIGRREDVPIIV